MNLNDWRIFAFGSAFFAALTAVLGKMGVSTLNSNLATLIRTFVILIFTVSLVTAKGEWVRPNLADSKSIVFLVLSGLATGASWLCYYRALQLGPVSKVAPVDKLSVALAILLAVIFLGESLSAKTIMGGMLIVLGSLVLAF